MLQYIAILLFSFLFRAIVYDWKCGPTICTYDHNPLYDCMQELRSQTQSHSTRATPLTTGAPTEHTGIT